MTDRKTVFLEITQFMYQCIHWISTNSKENARPSLYPYAKRILDYQKENHPVYRRYCESIPSENTPFPGFPPIPTDSFKREDLSPFPPELTIETFRSSGTTEAVKSSHRFRDLGLMQRAIFGFFPHMTMHGVASTTPRYMSLMPSHTNAPQSSLAYMLSEIVDLAGFGKSACYGNPDFSINVEALCADLEEAQGGKDIVHLMGPSFAYVQLLDALKGRTFKLPKGSRLLETGGYKGRTREIPKAELRTELRATFGLDEGMIYAEYGMCELSSQLYEIQPVCGIDKKHALENHFVAPPWCNIYVLDPDTLQQLPPGEEGQIAILDIANLDSAAFVLTGDLGTIRLLNAEENDQIPGRPYKCLQLKGRSPHARPKGCSLAFD